MKILTKQSGFSLIELMISVTIGSFLILGAAYAFQEAKRTYMVNDNAARLQEQAQFVLDILDEDIRHANFWGRHNIQSAVTRDGTANVAISGDCADRVGNANSPSPYNGWALDVEEGISGTNNVFPAWGIGCVDSNYKITTDTLVIRHADTQAATAIDANKFYLSSIETPTAIIFKGAPPATASPTSVNYELRSHGYYVRDYSFVIGDGVPMLRRMTLAENGRVQDQELAIGVEDFQVEFGVDTSALTGINRGSINRYVAPDNPILNPTHANYISDAQILSIRVWILMRAQNPELNYVNDAIYTYGDNTVTTSGADDFRRLLVSRTFQVRNSEL